MEINIHSRQQEFYRFSTDDFALIEIGIGSYTISSLENFLKTNNGTMSDDLNEFFTGETSNSLFNKFIGETYKGSMSIKEFDLTDKKYEETSSFSNILTLDTDHFPPSDFRPPIANDIRVFLENWNLVQRGSFGNDKQAINGYRAVAYKVQSSMSGCITFQATFNVLGRSRTSTIRLHLLESLDAESSRSISFKGSPIVTSMPQTPYGAAWGYRNTTAGDVGAYFSPSQEGESNPENTVSAPMDMAFDPSVGKWQSGTQQMLMRLVDDADAASVPELSPEELLAATRSEVYDIGEDSPFRIKFAGPLRAIPLSSENGNPHMFGPDYRDGCAGNNQAVVQVMNRMNIAYKAGSIIVCSKMLGDSGLWTIVGGLGKEASESPGKLTFGNFEYQQHVVPASLYFTDPSGRKMMPDEIASKSRLSYYLKLLSISDSGVTGGEGSSAKLFEDTVWLNLAASDLTETEEDKVIEELRSLYGDGKNIRSKKSELSSESKIGNMDALDFINGKYCDEYSDSYESIVPQNEQKKEYALPKNVQKRSADTVPGLVTGSSRSNDVHPGSYQIPIFWGMLFPDGYKAETVRNFRPLVSGIDIYRDDPNLSELTCGSTECVYDFKDQIKNLRFAKFLGVDAVPRPQPQNQDGGEGGEGGEEDGGEQESSGNYNALSFVRKTGGLYRPLKNLKNVINNPIKLLNYVNMVPENGTFYAERIKYAPEEETGGDEENTAPSGNPDGSIYGAEPVNPGRIQFSSLSLEAMYYASNIQEQNGYFQYLYRKLTNDGLRDTIQFSDGSPSAKFRDYTKFLIYPDKKEANLQATSVFDGLNSYNIQALDFDTAYKYSNSQLKSILFGRHKAPIGTIIEFGLEDIDGRVAAIPVLTCKSSITTSAQSLFFTCDQSIGATQKRTVSGGQGPTVTIFPIGGGIGWGTPNNPAQTWDFVQWGGDNDVDSLGTTALHVRVFEHVPPNQLIYLGPLFTPLHFNPSEPITKSTVTYDENNNPIVSGTDQPNILPSDFKVPTKKDGSIYDIDETVTKSEEEEGLAPYDGWKTNTIRRGKLLTKGGFGYFKPVIVASSASIVNGGSNYKKDDKLILSDGGEIIVKEVEDEDNKKGIIKSIEFKPNFSASLTKTPTNGYRSIDNVSPNGGSGSGAKFNFAFVIKYDIGYDAPPKESTASKGTLITSPNQRGELGHIGSQSNVSVELVRSGNNKNFDIFYFYHNDPSHYTLNDFMPFNNGFAQYVVSEVKAQ